MSARHAMPARHARPARHAMPARHRSGRADEIGLHSIRDQHDFIRDQHDFRMLGPCGPRILFRLPRLVATECDACAIIALCEQRQAQLSSEVRHGLRRGWQMTDRRASETTAHRGCGQKGALA